jgi:tetratricopeptide (TPR) repeat protein
MKSPDHVPASLGREGEAEWWRLRRQLDLADRFWLGFLFSNDPRVALVLRQRTAGVLRSGARILIELRPGTPDALQAMVAELLQGPGDPAGCIWLEALQADRPGGEEPWAAAWQELLLRLNGRRERLRRHLDCGLLLAMPSGLKDAVRRAAPDLWSIRGLVLEPPSPPVPDVAPVVVPAPAELPEGAEPVPGVELQIGGEPQGSDARALLRRAEGLLLRDQPRQAMSAATRALEQLDRSHPLAAQALAILARAKAADGDAAAAIEHLQAALQLSGEQKRSDVFLYYLWLKLALDRLGDLELARTAADGFLGLARQLVERNGESPESLRDLSVSLDNVAGVLQRTGDLGAA